MTGTPTIINNNSAAIPAATNAETLHRIVGADNASPRYGADAFNSNAAIDLRRANGTCATPSALVSGNNMGQFASFGHDGSTYTGGKGGSRVYANENWAPGANGTRVTLWSTANGATAPVDNLSVDSTGADLLTGSYKVAGMVGFTGTGNYSNFTVVGGIIVAAS